jgi:hypothetical protein
MLRASLASNKELHVLVWNIRIEEMWSVRGKAAPRIKAHGANLRAQNDTSITTPPCFFDESPKDCCAAPFSPRFSQHSHATNSSGPSLHYIRVESARSVSFPIWPIAENVVCLGIKKVEFFFSGEMLFLNKNAKPNRTDKLSFWRVPRNWFHKVFYGHRVARVE